LKSHTPENMGGAKDIDWNFAKFVVDKNGFPVVRYPSDWEKAPLEGWIEYELSLPDPT